MNMDSVNKWLMLLTNLGVIVGILLLVFELNQNRAMMMGQTRNDLSQSTIDFLLEVSQDEGRANVWLRGVRGQELTPDETGQFILMSLAEFRLQENIHYQYRSGLYDEGEFLAHREAWRNLYRMEGRAQRYCDSRDALSPEFVAEIDGLLEINNC